MITAAITALKERNGSSKKAISKYIDQVYPNLPAKHPALLTHHLKRLKNSGHIIMVKHSYKLSTRSAPPPPSAAVDLFPSSAPLYNTTTTTISAPPPPVGLVLPKKRPGRPPKLKPVIQGQQVQNSVGLSDPAQIVVPFTGPDHNFNAAAPGFAIGPDQNYNGPVPLSQKRKPGRPPKLKPVVMPSFPPVVVAHNPVVAQNAFAPPAVQTDTFPQVVQGNGPGPAPAIAKKRPGRPRKLHSGSPFQPRPSPVGLGGMKRRPGRPRKSGSVGVVNGQPKRRGRKPKNVQQATPFVAAAAVVPNAGTVVPQMQSSVAVPNAVPYMQAQAPLQVGVGVNGGLPVGAKRRGRPPNPLGALKKPRKLTGRPLGRPKKRAAAPDVSQHLTAYVNLKTKLDYMQSRIKETVNVLKPCFNNETSASAMGALQQLEELATLDVNAPLNLQGLQQV